MKHRTDKTKNPLKKYVLTNCVILDGSENMMPVTGMAVVVEDEKIREIVPESSEKIVYYPWIDLGGAYLLPGLINLHAHLAISGKPPKSDKQINYKKLFRLLSGSRIVKTVFRKSNAGYAKTALNSGVTTVRAVGGLWDLDAQNRDNIQAGKQDGPRILCANTAVSVPGGHFAGSIATEAASPEEAVQHVRMIAATKPDLIKLMITGGVMDSSETGEPGVLRMPPEIVKAACDEAHRLGYKVAAHVESTEGVKVALENGVDTIEHGAKPTAEILRLFKERGAADICTLSPAIPYARFTPEESKANETGKTNGAIVLDGIIQCAKACLENGIPVGLGNDVGCPFVTHYNFWRELVYFHDLIGVSNKFALYTATSGNAKIAGIDQITGSISPGKSADMIVVKENPLEDLKALRHIRTVIMKGRIYENPVIEPIKGVDELLDKYMDA
ncbi:MAG: amidohydrolase family protein [Erysipelotrichales bacterium]|nr:amidohydrolase family protein [Erysipelotrichales bacterium]MBQ4374799.1 amidohydrolase family protein [Erysipelotrichales bacterium]